jgi:hypothetical protein
MKITIPIGLLMMTAVTFISTSCSKTGLLDAPPVTNALDVQKTFSDSANTGKFLANCYAGLTNGSLPYGLEDFGNGQNYAQVSDEAKAGQVYLSVNGVNFGSVDATNNLDNFYAGLYTDIRRTNVLLSNRNLMINYTKATKDQYVAEAQFLRAFFYSELVKRYAGVPLVSSPTTFDEIKDKAAQAAFKANLKRISYADCINFMVEQLDSAAAILPWAPVTDAYRGRATAAACIALKAKVLLYAASKLYNNPQPASAGEPGGMSNPLIGYTNYDINRWKLADNACREFISKNAVNGNWYILYSGGYDKLFNEGRDAANQENIWYCQTIDNPIIYCTPSGRLGGYSSSNALLNLVDKYEMTNGKTITEEAGYSDQTWWVNRDSRLGMSFLKNGDSWKGINLELWSASSITAAGRDYYDVNRTCIFFKKYQRSDGNPAVQKWCYLRLADVYLMLAEAENELNGPTADVYTYTSLVRSRMGVNMPPFAAGLSQAQMRDKIRNERAVEFAFEAQRYYDERRWMIAGQVENAPVFGFKVTKEGITITHTRYQIEKRIFSNRMYLAPIPIAEIYKGADIQQNPGY